jgi:hypothetical protein
MSNPGFEMPEPAVSRRRDAFVLTAPIGGLAEDDARTTEHWLSETPSHDLRGNPRMNRIVPLILAVALFMEQMDSTVIATALPAIANDLGVSPITLKLALTSYMVSLAVFIPISGWMADRFGAKRIFRARHLRLHRRLDLLRGIVRCCRIRLRASCRASAAR